MQLTKTSTRNILCAAVATVAAFALALFSSGGLSSAQSSFVGDYDRTFAAPLGYYVDPEEVDPTITEDISQFYTGELLADGSIIAGGRFSRNVQNNPGDFYLRKFTAAGTLDTSFGAGGLVRTNFYNGTFGTNPAPSNEHPQVLRVQPDGKILFAGACHAIYTVDNGVFGNDACIVRYNATGTLDQSFGGGAIAFTNGGGGSLTNHSLQYDPGKAIFVTGTGSAGGTGSNGVFYDMAIQPDGKIVLVGETTNWYSNNRSDVSALIVRLNPNGSLDSTFGAGGIVRWSAFDPATGHYRERRFYGVRLQTDGRIIAVGHDVITRPEDGAHGTRFVVTRWTAAGQIETVRHITDLANLDVFFTERATAVLFTNDGGKLLVSGSARNLSGTPAGRQKPTLVRLNLSDLSLDTSFGSGGIAQYDVVSNSWVGSTLYAKAIQPDGKILGTDNTATNGNVVRLNPDGSPDLSFGNLGINDGQPSGRGRLRLLVTTYNGVTPQLEAGHILVRPNGKMNLLGHGAAHFGLGILRAVVSQNNVGNTQPGGDVIVQPAAGDARVTFSQVTAGGETTFTPINPASAGAPPAGYTILTNAPAYDITTTAQYTPPVTVCLTVSSVSDQATFARVRVLHGEGGQLVDRTILAPDTPAPDFPSRRVCARVQTLSPFVAALAPAAPTVQFSAANSAVSEADARVSVTVTRTGDTSAAATVDYQTADADTFTVGCADAAGAAGSAFARCDFATAVGTLQFAAGQTSKTISVPIIDDAHVEGAQTFQLRLSNATGATLGSFATATVTITDNDAAGAPNPVTSSTFNFFVRQQYLDFLSREPDAAGFNAWLGVLNGCPNAFTGPEVQSGCDRIFVSGEGFFRSVEFSLKGAYAFRFYKLAFNRLPEYTEITTDMSFVAGATEAEVFARRAELAVRFTQRQEFQNAYGGMTNQQYVNTLLGRYSLTQVTTRDPASPDTGGEVTLTAAQLAALPRDKALRAIADSDEVTSREFDNAFVAMQYYGYLRRKPEPTGYEAWLRVLQSGDVRTMVNGFLNSAEYKLRFGQP